MLHAIVSVNYLAVVVIAIIGFMLGWLWYSLLFGKAWIAEMKFTEVHLQRAAAQGMAVLFATGFAYTLLSTFGLAVLITAHGPANWLKAACFGLFVGCLVVGTRLLNGSLWEQRSLKLQLINAGHEVALFTLQGAILGVWH